MPAKRIPPDSFTSRQPLLETARHELDAARTLIAGLDNGGSSSCIHLVRAAGAVAPVAESLDDDEASLDQVNVEVTADSFTPPGISERLLAEWRDHMPTVIDAAGRTVADSGDAAKQVERSARTVHDILERSLLWTEREVRRRFSPDSWPTRLLWIVGAIVLCGAVLAVLIRSSGDRPPRAAPEAPSAGAAPHARQASQVELSELSIRKAQGVPWDAPGNIIISPREKQLLVTVGEPSHAPMLEISLDNNDRYRIEFLAENAVLADTLVGPTAQPGGLIVYRIEVPAEASEVGFDGVRVVPLEGDDFWAVGHLVLASAADDARP